MSSEIQGLYREFLNLLAQKRGDILKTASGPPLMPWDLGRGGTDPLIDVNRSYTFVTRDYETSKQCVRREELLPIQEAIQRMKTGIYGMCSTCHQKIEIEQLRRAPEGSHCLNCKTT